MNQKEVAMKVSTYTIIVNSILTILKLIAGIIAHSGAMISDAVHTASDVFSTVVVMIGVTISAKEADEKHQYGHERLECVAAILLAVILFATGMMIGYKAVIKIAEGNYDTIIMPGRLALFAAIASILAKEVMYWYTRAAAIQVRSTALMADAWHHRSDALSSVGSLIGIAGARFGITVMDLIASLVICCFILKAATSIFVDAVRKLIDESCDKELQEQMKVLILHQEGVEGIDVLKTRQFGDRIYIDVEIVVDGSLSVSESHEIAQQVHDVIEAEFLSVKHCMVHINPKSNLVKNGDNN